MTQYVLLNTRTGNLFIGTKVCFYDQTANYKIEGIQYSLACISHDGWILEHPDLVVPRFCNRSCEGWFEVLGKL